MSSENIVYITQNNRKNYSSAHSFGEPTFITSNEYDSIGNSNVNDEIMSEIRDMVANYDNSRDYILLSGDPIVIALVVHAALSRHESIRVLKWDAQERIYIPITLTY